MKYGRKIKKSHYNSRLSLHEAPTKKSHYNSRVSLHEAPTRKWLKKKIQNSPKITSQLFSLNFDRSVEILRKFLMVLVGKSCVLLETNSSATHHFQYENLSKFQG